MRPGTRFWAASSYEPDLFQKHLQELYHTYDKSPVARKARNSQVFRILRTKSWTHMLRSPLVCTDQRLSFGDWKGETYIETKQPPLSG
jgi:hypothetical protein